MPPRLDTAENSGHRCIVFVQHGDFRETCQRFAQGLPETYYAQRHSVEFVCNLCDDKTDVVVICLKTDPYDERLPNGVRTIGCRIYRDTSPRDLAERIARLEPTHVVLRTPIAAVLAWCLQNQVQVLPILADSFRQRGVGPWFRNRRLVQLLNHPAIPLVANHNVPATESLAAIGVSPTKLAAWDWPHRVTPQDFPPKQGLSPGDKVTLLFVGAVSEAKGVGDCVRAMPAIVRARPNTRLDIVGQGDVAPFRRLADQLRVESQVEFVGRLPNTEIVPRMRASDIVLVPSRHSYPEGIPMTIYEALSARTPIVMSDHPMFASRFRDSENAMVFSAGDSTSLSEKAIRLSSDPVLYAKISANAAAAWESLQCQFEWSGLVRRFLSIADPHPVVA